MKSNKSAVGLLIPKPSKDTNIIMISVLLSVPLGQLFIDIYVPAFNVLKESFSTSAALIQLSLTLYFIMLGACQVVYGSLSDVLGRKKPLIFGLALGLVGSVVAKFSTNIDVFLIARIIQGIGMAGVAGIGGAIIVDSFASKPTELAKKNTYLSITYNLTPIIAPYIGGSLLYLLYWQAIFEFLFVYNLLVLLWIVFVFKETNTDTTSFSIKKYVDQFKNYKIYLSNNHFWYASVIMGAFWAMTISFMSMGPFIFNNLYQVDGYHFGILALVLGLASFVGSVLTRLLLHFFSGTTLLVRIMLVNLMFCLILIPVVIIFTSYFLLIIAIFFMIFLTYGAMYPNVYTVLMLLFKNNAGSALSLSVAITITFCMLVTAVCVIIPKSIYALAIVELSLSILSFILIALIISKNKR